MTNEDKQDVIAICNILADKMSDSGKVAVQQIIDAVKDMVENEPCEDAISRKDVIILIDEATELHPYKVIGDSETYSNYNQGWEDACNWLYANIESDNLKTVTPQPKTGHWKELGIVMETRWIPVSEKIPNKYGDYLVTFRISFMNFIEVCTFNKAGWDKGGYDEVIAWMPLPQPYKGESEDNE